MPQLASLQLIWNVTVTASFVVRVGYNDARGNCVDMGSQSLQVLPLSKMIPAKTRESDSGGHVKMHDVMLLVYFVIAGCPSSQGPTLCTWCYQLWPCKTLANIALCEMSCCCQPRPQGRINARDSKGLPGTMGAPGHSSFFTSAPNSAYLPAWCVLEVHINSALFNNF